MLAWRSAAASFIVAVTLLGGTSEVHARRSASSKQVKVSYATTEGAYIDRGTAHGLRVGDTLTNKAGKSVCRIVRIADHSALCATKTAKVGDTLVVPRFEPRVPPQPKTHGAAAIPSSLIRRRAQRFKTAKFEPVKFDGDSGTVRGPLSNEVAGRYRVESPVWVARSRTFQSQTIRLSVRGQDLGAQGLRVDASVAGRYWTQRPNDFRLARNPPNQLDVWQLSVSYRDPTRNLHVAAGRMRPRFVPGVSLVDGAQLGWRIKGRNEVGVFGGLLPDLVTTRLRNDRWIAGGYAVHELAISEETMLRATARLSMVSFDDQTATGGEIDARMRVSRRTHIGGAVSVQAGDGPLFVDRWSADASSQIGARFRVHAGARYLDSRRSLLTGTQSLYLPGITRRADLGASAALARGIDLDVSAGQLDELESGVTRQYVGPTIHIARWIPGRSRLSLGYAEELGTQPAHTGIIALQTRPADRWAISGRLGAMVGSDALDSSSFGSVQTRYRIFDRLQASASFMSYTGRLVLLGGTGLRTQAGFSGQLALSGSF